jgi:hypothetical protein
VIQRGGHNEHGLPYSGRAKITQGNPGDPLGQALECDPVQRHNPPSRQDIQRQQPVVLVAGLWLEVGTRVQPGKCVLAEGDAPECRVSPVSPGHECALSCQPAFGVVLAPEALSAFAAVWSVSHYLSGKHEAFIA